MKVAREPLTLLVDPPRCELAILTGGIRIAMTGDEASAFWAELGEALKKIYAERADRCPSKFADFLLREPAAGRQPPTAGNKSALEQALARVIAYAHRPSPAPDSGTDPSPPVADSISQPQGPPAGTRPGDRELTRR